MKASLDIDLGTDTHVVPLDDWIEHPASVTCSCQPAIMETGCGGRIVIHNAADGREHFTDGDEPPDETIQ